MTRRAAIIAWCGLSVLPAAARASSDLRDGLLGSACEQDSDCTEGLSCFDALGASLDGRALARGLCSLPCDTDASCAELFVPPVEGFDAVCRDVGGTSLCLEPCTFGDAYNGIVKCHLREDMACADLGIPVPGYALGGCVPQCSYDEQCGERFCNQTLGLCQDTPLQGDPVGASCDPSAEESSCAGFCVPFVAGAGGAGGASTGTCTDYCVTNGPFGCGWSGQGVPNAQCEPFIDGIFSVGDLGQCIELCDCDRDCRRDDAWCSPGPYVNRGKCVAKSLSPEHLPECYERPELGSCHFGEVRTCRGDDGCFGTAPCLEDRSGYAACECVELPEPGDGGDGGAAVDAGPHVSGGGQAGDASPAGDKPNISGRTPEPSCQCSVRPRAASVAALVWLTALASSLVARRQKRRRPRRTEPH